MNNNASIRSARLLLALAAFFCGLLLTATFLPSLFPPDISAVNVPVSTEEEQHGCDMPKLRTVDHHEWQLAGLFEGQRLNAALRDRGARIPQGPVAEVTVPPPKNLG